MTAKAHLAQTLVDGKSTQCLPLTDRSWQYGDGCFTTVAVAGGELVAWDRHWQRLLLCQQKLGLAVVTEERILADWSLLKAEFQAAELHHAVLKIVLTRGDGGRGYQVPDAPVTRRVLSLSGYPEHYQQWRENGVLLGQAQLQLARQPALAGLKTLNRLEQVLLKQELKQQGEQSQLVDDLVVTDTAGYVIETTVANLFWRCGNTWFTPDLSAAGIAGVAREQVLALNPHVQVGHYRMSDLAHADEIVLSNSLLGIVPVKRFADRDLPGFRCYPQQLESILEPV
mgnify:CR=1 FL=1